MLVCPRKQRLAEEAAVNKAYAVLQDLWDRWAALVKDLQGLQDLAKRLERQETDGRCLGNVAITGLFVCGERLGAWLTATTKDLHKVATRHDAWKDEAVGGPDWPQRQLTEKQLMDVDMLLDMGLEGAELIRDELKRLVRLDQEVNQQLGEEQVQLQGLSTAQSMTRLKPVIKMLEMAMDRGEDDVLAKFEVINELKPSWVRKGNMWVTIDPDEREPEDDADDDGVDEEP